jgi:hypothetical protein
MKEAVKIILARMDTNPEEFKTSFSRWAGVLSMYESILSEEEANALKEKGRAIQEQSFTEDVMNILMEVSSPTPLEKLRVDSNGAVHIGTTAPETKLRFNTANRYVIGETK